MLHSLWLRPRGDVARAISPRNVLAARIQEGDASMTPRSGAGWRRPHHYRGIARQGPPFICDHRHGKVECRRELQGASESPSPSAHEGRRALMTAAASPGRADGMVRSAPVPRIGKRVPGTHEERVGSTAFALSCPVIREFCCSTDSSKSHAVQCGATVRERALRRSVARDNRTSLHPCFVASRRFLHSGGAFTYGAQATYGRTLGRRLRQRPLSWRVRPAPMRCLNRP